MRKLTVRRRKALIGCFWRVKIYVEDPMGDTIIRGFKCTFLGEVENDDSATFEIPCDSVKIFAIYGELGKSFCNDYCIVPAGEDEVFVSGKCRFNRVTGHPFQFDDATETEVLDNRMKGHANGVMIRVIGILIGLVIAGIIVACRYLL